MRPRKSDAEEREDHVLLRNHREHLPCISGRSHGERRNRAAVGYREQHPSIKKCDQIAIRFAKINILSPRLGEHGTKFGEGYASEQRDDAANHPHQQKQHGMRQRAGNVFSGKKNGRADDAADQQQNGIEQAESANQSRLGRSGLRREGCGFGGSGGVHYPIPSSSEDSSAVPQRRQMTDEQSPQVSGSFTSSAQFGQYNAAGSGSGGSP